MADETKDLDIDLDEDLFDFGEAALSDAFDGDDDADLDEIFAAFQDAQLNEPAAPAQDQQAPEEEDEEEDEGDLEDFFQPEEDAPATVPVAAPAPAPPAQDVWTPERTLAPEAPAAAPQRPRSRSTQAPVQVVTRTGLPSSAVWALVAITSINALVAIVTLGSMSSMRSNVVEVGRHVTATADEIRSGAYEQSRVLNELQTPVVPLDAEEHPTFDRARNEISAGDYSSARRRLYALLSIIDRLDQEQRAKVEARAQFLLAEALHLEALERLEAER